MADIYHQVLIQADRKTVYEAVTTKKGLSNWWIATCKVKPEVGFMNEFATEGYGTNYMKVLVLEPEKLVKWECNNLGDAWKGTFITFAISEKGAFTCLDFKHEGYASADEVYATCNYHWARHLFMLKVYCEKGISLLNQEQESKEIKAVHGTKL
ncbi:SRPBCC family protein [Pontibacter sp. MBLB2868]|uniref:SRPBCC family protein n=1 Tax=Pontibacter sp. MBLB2868 TaxID=3451555 RepID=UPI003F74DF9B